jgi:hypothetical protein
MPGCLTEPSPFKTGLGLRLISGSRNFAISVPRESDLESVGIWLRNLKFSKMVLDVWREAIEVGCEIGLELVLAGAGFQVAQGELGGVVEGLPSGIAERGSLLGDAGFVEQLFGLKDGILCRLQHGVEAAQDAHRQDNVRIFAALEEVAENIIGDAPNERDDFVVGGLVHFSFFGWSRWCGE